MRKLIVTGFGTGHLPVAPGTWGSASVAGVFWVTGWLGGGDPVLLSVVMAVLAAAASVACVALGRFAETTFGRKDPPECTIDEWAGQALAFLLLPAGGGPERLLVVAGAGFLAFRLFDILKPPPAGRLERLPAGWGILLDDLAAGLYANLLCQLLFWVWLGW